MMRALILSLLIFSIALPVYAKRYGSKLCQEEGYTCYTVKKGESWKSLFPDEAQRETAMKINRTNNHLHKGMVIAIPHSFGESYLDFSPFPRQGDVTGGKYIIVSLGQLAFGAYGEDGQLQYWGPISSGQSYCRDVRRGCKTPTGQFAIYNKGGAGCASSKYPLGRGGAPMPYCMFFHKGYALHGSNDVPGYNASHGCVRLFTNDAKWLNKEFTAGVSKVPVTVTQ